MWFRIQIGWHIVKGPLQGQPPGLSCGNVGQMRSHNTVHMDVCTYLWVYMHLWIDVHLYDGFTSTWTDGVNVLYLHTSWSGEGLHWNRIQWTYMYTPTYIVIGHSLHYLKYTPHTQSPQDHSQHTIYTCN